MSTTHAQTLLVTHPSHEPVAEGSIPLTLLESTSPHSPDEVHLPTRVSRLRKVVITIQMCGVTFAWSVTNGMVTIGLPAIAKDLQLPPSLAFWPASVSGLATASTLLLAGSVADVIGPRGVELVGCFASGLFTIGSGAARKGSVLVAMQTLQGVGLSLHLASSVSIITQVLPQGRGRNMAFSCMGLSQPLGFSVGLVLGGIMVDTVGWRVGWYLSGGLTLLLSIVGLWALPKTHTGRRLEDILKDVRTKVDWIGAILASGFMAMLCYLLASVQRLLKKFAVE